MLFKIVKLVGQESKRRIQAADHQESLIFCKTH